jgi:hypothetical protein
MYICTYTSSCTHLLPTWVLIFRVRVCVCVYIYIYMHANIVVYSPIAIYIYIHIYIYIYIYACIPLIADIRPNWVILHIYVYLYIYIYIYTHTCMYTLFCTHLLLTWDRTGWSSREWPDAVRICMYVCLHAVCMYVMCVYAYDLGENGRMLCV